MSTMHTRGRRLAAAGAALTLCAVLAACGDDTGTGEPASTAAPSAPTRTASPPGTAEASSHNDADTVFAQGMIAHHQSAVDMARTAERLVATTQVAALAGRIAEAQDREIEQMSQWLTSWGEERTPGHDEGDHDGHGGTDTEEATDMGRATAELRELSGTDVDRRFLEVMVEHHRDAIPMSEAELEDGANADAQALAEKIIRDQTAEIAEMETLLGAL